MPSQLLRHVCLVLCLALLWGCAAKAPVVYKGRQSIADLENFPQDLNAYLGADQNSQILTPAEAADALAKYRSTLYAAWSMKKPSISKRDASLMVNRKTARGWKNGSVKWKNAEWLAMRKNANMASYPNMNRPGIVVRTTDLREMPTHTPRFTKPTPDPREDPFDYFQYSRLPIGMPVLLCHISKDRRWYYVETPLACGWVDARDLAPISEPFMAMWKSTKPGAIVRENVQLGAGQTADIGVVLPMPGSDTVLVPVKGANGEATFAKVQLVPGSVEPMPLRMTPANVARLGNQMIGQKYGWGGMFGLRDCSAMTRDLMAPFGVWLPRNSQAQARAGERISLQGMNARQKEVTVREKGVPFASLVTMKGHVVLYVGAYRGRPVILHDIWGVRVDEPAGEDNRLILGRVVLTSMTPGKELPTLTDGQTIVERFHTLTVLGGTPR